MASMSLPPGFRFHPTDEELVGYYLRRKINGRKIELEIISEVDLYKCEPWDLPEKSLLPGLDMEWYFFSPMDRKYPNGSRTNRATKAGYWKATGKDRLVCSQRRPLGMKKTLVYYTGRAPHGSRTNWVMHEYRLDEHQCETRSGLQDAYSLCRVLKKNGPGPKIVDMHGIRSYVEPLECTSDLWDYSYSTIHETFSSELRTGEDMQNICYPYNDQQELLYAPVNTTNSCTEEIKLLVQQPLNIGTDRCCPIKSDNFVCHPSMKTQVDVAVERAEFQRRLSLPELEMESVTQFEFLNNQDLLPSNSSQRVGAEQPGMVHVRDIFSNAFASREQMYDSKEQGMWEWEDDHGLPALTEFGSGNRDQPITINEEIGIQKMGSSESSQTSNCCQLLEGPNSVMIESISSFQGGGPKLSIDKGRIKQHDNVSREGNNFGDQSCCSDYLGFVSDDHPPAGYLTECNIEDAEEYCLSTLDYEMGKKIEVNHGMLTVTRSKQADTIFHEVEPCRTVCLHSSDELMESSTKAGWLKAFVRDLVEAVEKILVL